MSTLKIRILVPVALAVGLALTGLIVNSEWRLAVVCAVGGAILLATLYAILVRAERRRASEPFDEESAARALAESEERFRRLSEAAFEGIVLSDQGLILDANEQFARLFGYELHEVVGMHARDLVEPKSRSLVMQKIKSGQEGFYEHIGLRKDGTVFPVEASAKSIPYRGRIVRVTVLRDCTERKRAEEALRYRSAFENLIASISTKFINLATDDVDNGINDALQALGEFVRVDRSYVFLFTDDGSRLDNTHEWCAQGIEPTIQRLSDLPADGFPWFIERIRRFETVHVPRVAELPSEACAEKQEWQEEGIQSLVCVPTVCAGKLIGFVGFDSVHSEKTWDAEIVSLLRIVGEIFANTIVRKHAEDALTQARDDLELRVTERTADLTAANERLHQEISERRRAEVALQDAKEAAEAASRAKTDFLSRMSHEIRTPLTVILACAEMLSDSKRSRRAWLECAETVKRNGRHLLELVNDILDVSKISIGKMQVERIDCDLLDLVNEVKVVAVYKAKAKAIDVQLKVDPQTPRRIFTDPTKLRQILINLTDNAVKFTREGSVRINVSLAQIDQTKRRGRVRFVVSDTGIGIERDKLTAIFDAFSQADSSITRRYGGTGLGLTISRRMVDLLGGSLQVESEVGCGSTFTLELPFDATAEVSADQHATGERTESNRETNRLTSPELALAGMDVLVGDDCDDIRRMVEWMLRQAGAKVTCVCDGKSVVDHAAQHPYDVALLDVHMPDEDGRSAVGRLRRLGIKTPLIAITADATADSRRSCLDAGFDEFIVKPFRSEELVSVIQRLRSPAQGDVDGKRRGDQTAAKASESDALTPIRSTLAGQSPALAEAVSMFVQSTVRSVERLNKALQDGDFSTLVEVSHQLAGSGGINGYLCISDEAAVLQRAARDRDAAEATARIAGLRSLSQRMIAGLNSSPYGENDGI